MSKKVRYAILGSGDHALRGHAIPALEVPELELIAACDPDDAKMLEVQQARGPDGPFARFKTEEALLAASEIDAVVIASPDRYHAASLEAAVKAGKHVLCEKPLAVTFRDLVTIEKALIRAEKAGLVVTSCHPRRFDPPYLWVKQMMTQFVLLLGEIQCLQLDFSYHKPSKTGLHEGLLADHLNHELDLAHFLFGHCPARLHKLHDSAERYVAVGMRQDGIALNFSGTRRLESHRYPEFVEIRFERGKLELNCETGNALITDHERNSQDLRRAGKTDYAERFRAIMANFAASILGREPNYLTHQDLLANASSCVALTESEAWNYRP